MMRGLDRKQLLFALYVDRRFVSFKKVGLQTEQICGELLASACLQAPEVASIIFMRATMELTNVELQVSACALVSRLALIAKLAKIIVFFIKSAPLRTVIYAIYGGWRKPRVHLWFKLVAIVR
jgi:hypothetical protein